MEHNTYVVVTDILAITCKVARPLIFDAIEFQFKKNVWLRSTETVKLPDTFLKNCTSYYHIDFSRMEK